MRDLLEAELDEAGADELRAALRRAVLLLAAGGDPHRELDPAGRAVTALADELGEEPLAAGLERLVAGLAPELREEPEVARTWAALELLRAELLPDP